MDKEAIKKLQARIGTEPDGFWGPKSIAKCQAHLRSLYPKPYPFPTSKGVRKFYGDPGDGLTTISVKGMAYIGSGTPQPISTIRCHEKVADSLQKILAEIAASEHAWILKEYAGCYNHRNMRGSDKLSMHSWGIAVDFWPRENGFTTPWPVVADMPFEVMEIFARHGWSAGGAFWGRDAMHFEAIKR